MSDTFNAAWIQANTNIYTDKIVTVKEVKELMGLAACTVKCFKDYPAVGIDAIGVGKDSDETLKVVDEPTAAEGTTPQLDLLVADIIKDAGLPNSNLRITDKSGTVYKVGSDGTLTALDASGNPIITASASVTPGADNVQITLTNPDLLKVYTVTVYDNLNAVVETATIDPNSSLTATIDELTAGAYTVKVSDGQTEILNTTVTIAAASSTGTGGASTVLPNANVNETNNNSSSSGLTVVGGQSFVNALGGADASGTELVTVTIVGDNMIITSKADSKKVGTLDIENGFTYEQLKTELLKADITVTMNQTCFDLIAHTMALSGTNTFITGAEIEKFLVNADKYKTLSHTTNTLDEVVKLFMKAETFEEINPTAETSITNEAEAYYKTDFPDKTTALAIYQKWGVAAGTIADANYIELKALLDALAGGTFDDLTQPKQQEVFEMLAFIRGYAKDKMVQKDVATLYGLEESNLSMFYPATANIVADASGWWTTALSGTAGTGNVNDDPAPKVSTTPLSVVVTGNPEFIDLTWTVPTAVTTIDKYKLEIKQGTTSILAEADIVTASIVSDGQDRQYSLDVAALSLDPTKKYTIIVTAYDNTGAIITAQTSTIADFSPTTLADDFSETAKSAAVIMSSQTTASPYTADEKKTLEKLEKLLKNTLTLTSAEYTSIFITDASDKAGKWPNLAKDCYIKGTGDVYSIDPAKLTAAELAIETAIK